MSSDSAGWSVKSAVFSSFLSHCLQSSELSEQTPKVCGVINTALSGPSLSCLGHQCVSSAGCSLASWSICHKSAECLESGDHDQGHSRGLRSLTVLCRSELMKSELSKGF